MYRLGMRPSQGEAHQEHFKAYYVVSFHTLHFTVCSTVVHLNLSKFYLKNRKKFKSKSFTSTQAKYDKKGQSWSAGNLSRQPSYLHVKIKVCAEAEQICIQAGTFEWEGRFEGKHFKMSA